MLTHTLRTFKCNVSHLQPLFYSSSSTPITPSFSKYLVESLGFTEQQSLTTHSKLDKRWQTHKIDGEKKVSNFKFTANADSVVNLFKQHGFNDTHIKKIVSYDPRILSAKVDKTLIPKFRVLQERGFSGSDIAHIVSAHPYLLHCKIESVLLTSIETLKQVLGCDHKVTCLLKKSCWKVSGGVVKKNLVSNVELLRSLGVPMESILKQIMRQPSVFLTKTNRFEEVVSKVESKLGIPPHSKMFLAGIQLLIGFTEKTIDSKIEAFKSFGWTESHIEDLCKRNPAHLGISVLGIKKKLGFLMKELGYTPEYLITHPALFSYSLENRIVPRHTILEVLRTKGLIREDYPLYNAVCLTEISFMNKFVLPFKEVHGLYSELYGYLLSLPTEESEKENCEELSNRH